MTNNKVQTRNFILLLLLFVTFRALTLLAYRPGGLVLDFSDFYWYREFAQLSRQGYIAYQSLWSPYPPLFSLIMVGIWKLSTFLPPWNEPNLFFTLLFGGTLLIFETGALVVLYAIGKKIAPERALFSAGMYALFFVPVYTMTGHFEGLPIFFFLLSLYLLLENRPYLSAVTGGIGFMIKLLPVLLLPVGVQLLPKDGKFRLKLPALNLDISLWRAVGYVGVFAAAVTAIGYPFYRMNPALIGSPLAITAGRQSWETVWALLEGNFHYGVAPLDMRNMAWTPADGPGSPLPWGVISVIFAAIGAFLVTRRIEWRKPKVAVAFTALVMCLFFLYSKGYSPQWLGWLLVFIALLLPNLRGGIYASILSVVNIIEGNVFFAMFPAEGWLLAATVITRTVIIALLGWEFALMVWPKLATRRAVSVRRWLPVALAAALLAGAIPAGARLGSVYFSNRLENSPYSTTIRWLDEQPVKEAILLNDQMAYDWFFPYLRGDHRFYMLDDYADATTSVDAKMAALLNRIAAENNAVWVFDANPATTTPAEESLARWLGGRAPAHQADIDGGRLYLYILK